MSTHPTISGSVNLSRAMVIAPAPGKTAYLKIDIGSKDPDATALWSIVFRNTDPSSEVACGCSANPEFSCPAEDVPLYVTHWEQIGNTMEQIDCELDPLSTNN